MTQASVSTSAGEPLAELPTVAWQQVSCGRVGLVQGEPVVLLRQKDPRGVRGTWLTGRAWGPDLAQTSHAEPQKLAFDMALELPSVREFTSMKLAQQAVMVSLHGAGASLPGKAHAVKPLSLKSAMLILMEAAQNDARGSGMGYRSTSEKWRVQLARAWAMAHAHTYGFPPGEGELRNSGMLNLPMWAGTLNMAEVQQARRDAGLDKDSRD